MVRGLWLLWMFFMVLLVELQGVLEDGERGEERAGIPDQPRMLSDNGHLIFSPGNSKDICFRPSASGRVKVGDEDLTLLITQIKSNKADIEDIKANGGAVPPDVTNKLNQLSTKVTTLESKVSSLELTVQKVSCSSNPCQNGGTCLNLLSSYHCLCPNNWGGPNCGTDVNECQTFAGTLSGCQNGATCVNTPGSFSCSCPPEWSGSLCTQRYDDCRGAGQDLCVHGTCIDADRVTPGQPKYQCICEPGWDSPAGNPACVADVDECSLPNKPCSTNPSVECFNTQGSFHCGACPAGWQGNGYSCQDVDECRGNNGGCSTSPLVQCLNTMGSFHCGPCPPGYQGDGRTCTQSNICETNNGGCYPLATCSSTTGSSLPICTCPPGYTGSGYGPSGCTQTSNICQTNNPCVNGQCVPTSSSPGYLCTCNPGWGGVHCDQDTDDCSSSPCQNGGTCVDQLNGFTCTCPSQWTGPLCQTPQQECGGFLSGPAGSFSYPNNPGHEEYDHMVSCAWVIRTEPNKILHITFPYFELETSYNCNADFLQIHDGESASAFMIGRYCGVNNPSALSSSHNALYFWFRSDHSVKAGGFTVVWQSQDPVCGDELTAPYGSINSPGYPGNYPPSRDCYWSVTVSPGLLITFAFGVLSLEDHPDCNFDYLEVRDGLLPEDPVLGRYCSTSSPAPVVTTGPNAWIHFHSDSSVSDRGFHITYTTSPSDPGCGGTFTDTEGIIISPNWPNDYAHNRQCVYIIRLPQGEKVSLNFTHMNLESHSSCVFDYVEVRDGLQETAPLIGRFCGSVLPAPLLSSSSSLWIRFRSDSSVSHAGFRAVYTVACGGVLSGTGQLRSPLHPNAYPHNKVCEWVISQPQGYVVTLNFLSFSVEGGSCRYDSVQVRDGASSSAPLLGTFCGTQIPPRLQSTQRSLYVRFQTDSSVSNLGFLADYGRAIEGCGATMTSPSGVIVSPGHPNTYPHGANCTWFISVAPGNIIRLTFDSFNLEYHSNCNFDYVELYDNGTVETGTKLGRFCGRSVPPSVTSTDSLLTLLFVSDSSLSTEGFSAQYVSINATSDCSESFTSSTGSFFSPNYPSYYPNGRDCFFTITVQVNLQIMLNFTDFELEGSPPSCNFDFVEIRDGGYETSPLIGKWCGTNKPPVLVSHSNRLWVRFRSDATVTQKGFTAHWDGTQSGCGGTMSSASGGFSSPNYPLPYHPNAECYWSLRTSPGSQLLLSFSDFHLETSASCSFDYLAVYDGNSSSASQLAQLCGSQRPGPIASSRNQLYIKLRTDSSVSAGGFIASYSTNCSGMHIQNQYRGVLESLNFPSEYPPNTYCTWTILASSGNNVSYSFSAFQLEGTSGSYCSHDYVKLYNGPNSQAPLLGTFCGSSPPPPGSTTSSALTVIFRSDISVARLGFQMLWSQIGCGGELHGPAGSFHSPGYPNKYPDNRECVWYISTATGSSITITIHEFDVEFHQDCNYDVLEVYGGPDLQAPQLVKLCSTTTSPMQVSSTGNIVTVRFTSDQYVSGRGFNASWVEAPGGCGGPITAPSGEIHSPLYPNSYPNNVDCSWVISVDPNHRVLFNFTDLDIEFHSNCTWDYVEIHDGPSLSSPLLAHVCGSTLPSAITSTSNTIFVRFRSDSSRNHRGFRAYFSEACGASIMTDNVGGAIASPRYPAPYGSNLNCSWILKAVEPFNHVTLSFTDFELESHPNCSHDAVQIRDGDNYQAPAVGRYCSSEVPHPVTSFSNALVVSFLTDGSVSGRGFRATYSASTSSCGGDMVMETGAFNSPNYPDPYPPNVECVWTIRSSPGNHLQLSFTMFSLQGGANCASDFLEVREGNSTGLLVGRFCGNALPSNYTSLVGHVLWVKFVSDGAVSGAGFRATFSHLYGNDVSGEQGQIASPLYPRTYPYNAHYQWTITVDGDSLVEIRFQDIDIEDLYECYYDHLKIFDGPSVHYYPLGVFCGLLLPPPVRSSGSTVTLLFESDTVVGGRGFLIEWRAVQNSGPPPTIPPGACGGSLTTGDSPGFLFSPGWPQNYPHEEECTWLIRSPDSTVELNLLYLDMEDYPNCYFDSLVIRDGPSILSPVLATVCGREVPGPLHSSADSMYIHFSSDSSVSGRGFNASYSRGCGGLLHSDRGILSSPLYPQNYRPNADCSWHVMVTPGFRVSVAFQSPFQIQGFGTGCSTGDYLELRNGQDTSAPLLARLCGASPPALLQTTDNHLHLRFKSDSSNEASGFKLTFEAHSQACGGHIQLHDGDIPGYITSPGYPQNYPQNIDCVWVITVPNGEAVQLDFQEDFYIEHTTNCQYDYLEVRDGSDSSAGLLSRLCGNILPSTQRSSGSSMTLRFRTDTSVTHKGFKAQYSISTCGGRFIGQTGLIHSPGFPGSNYPDGSQCEWFLEGPTGHYLTLTYKNLSLTSSSGCSQDYLEIREYNASGLVLGRHCGSTLPAPMDTSDSFAFVKFVSDGSGNAPGFSLMFEASVEVCGGELNAPSGTISSPNYPNLYPHSRVCRWDVVAAPGRRVTLTINDLRLEGSGTSCFYDYVEVLNGLAADAPRLQRFCGSVPAGTLVRSSGNTMAVVFRTDASVSNGGFSATYFTDEPAVCGGILGSTSGGNITSPGYPLSNYSSNLNCEWLIQNHHHINSSIVVLIQDLHLQSHQTCANDYLQFRLGDANGEQLATFCGQTTPRVPIVVFTPQLYLHFQTDSSVGDLGFRAQYSFSECGGWQMGEGGLISSPNYPAVYPGPSRCAWLLEAPVGHTITVTFTYFSLEPHSTCSWDSLTIFNGGSPGSPVIGQYCGTSSPGTVQSGSNKLAVVFLADHSVSRGGFVATWSADSSGCGGVIHADSGIIKSPNYPQNFPANSECLWHIIAHEGNHLEMSFSPDFQIPDSSATCSSSYVKVWSGRAQNSDTLLSSSCGSVAPQPVIAPGNLLTVRFQSTGATAKGFSASFSTRCGMNFTATRGSVVSPNYPSDYPNRANCNYTIDAGEQTVVVLTFRVFQLEAHSSCSYDGLKVFNLRSGGLPIATVCGSTIPGPFYTLGPMRLNFYSDSVVSDTGFMAEYSAFACGGFFNSSSGTISSPAHSLTDYLHNINCSYHIMVQDNRVIDLKFNQFDLEASSSCRYDYVAVYDGPNTWAPLLGTFCGSQLPPKLRSSSNNLYLVFKTDSSVSKEGWRATYSQTLGPAQGCGGYLSMPMGMLGSPDVDLDGRYEPYLDCTWTIELPINRAVNLSFSSFDLESSSTCRYDYVKIYDGDSSYWPLVGTLCGSSIPSSFLSSGNFLTVVFKTDGSVQRAGFNATYMSVPLGCGGVLNATTALQTLTSPSFPQPYPAFTSCRWVLDAPPQETIYVAVQIFVFQPSQSCSSNYLEMKDWPLGDYGQSHKFCAEDEHPPDFYSIGRTIHVNFKSDAYMTGNGLSFTYKIAGCSRTYDQEYGFLKSPGWPNIYPHNQDCTIILNAPANHIISFFFNSFNMENHPQCSFDYLEVRNGSTADAPLLGKFCGSTVPSPIFPQSNQLYLRFKSDYSQALDGFEATWTSSPHGCGGTLYGDHGSFASPNFPGTYPNGTHCEWAVSAPRGRVVTVTFAQISIDDEGSCERNYLKLYDGPDVSSPLVGAYCGTETNIAPYTSSSHRVYFVFEAQSAALPSGFRLTWSS